MATLEGQARRFEEALEALERAGDATRLAPDRSWPAARSLVLADQVAVELGNPAVGSLAAVLWTTARRPDGSSVHRLGPDLGDRGARSRRFGQLVLVSGAWGSGLDDEYELLLELQEALCDVALAGVTLRTRPSSQGAWYRVSRDALAHGFSLAHLGGALAARLEAVAGVEAAAIVFLTGADWPAPLQALAAEAGRVARALVKRCEEEGRECEVCEFADLCDQAVAR